MRNDDSCPQGAHSLVLETHVSVRAHDRVLGTATPPRVGSVRAGAREGGRRGGAGKGAEVPGGPQKVEGTPGPERRDDWELGPKRNLSEKHSKRKAQSKGLTALLEATRGEPTTDGEHAGDADGRATRTCGLAALTRHLLGVLGRTPWPRTGRGCREKGM